MLVRGSQFSNQDLFFGDFCRLYCPLCKVQIWSEGAVGERDTNPSGFAWYVTGAVKIRVSVDSTRSIIYARTGYINVQDMLQCVEFDIIPCNYVIMKTNTVSDIFFVSKREVSMPSSDSRYPVCIAFERWQSIHRDYK